MQFANPLADGIYLVRASLRSPNYLTGLTGWTINNDGTAEFNDALFRGDLIVGTPPSSWISINNDPEFPDFPAPFAKIDFHTASGGIETAPARIYADSDVGTGVPILSLASPEFSSGGQGILQLTGPRFANPSTLIIDSTVGVIPVYNLTTGALYWLGEILSGPESGLHVTVNANQVRAHNGAAASELYLNYSGGVTICGLGGVTTLGGTINAPSGTIGAVTISGGVVSNAAGSALGAALIVGGGQINAAVSPPTGAGPGAGTAWWNLTGGTNYRLSRTTSSRRYKENILPLSEYTVEQLLALEPKRYQRNDNRDYTKKGEPVIPVTDKTPWTTGFIAEEAMDLGLISWVGFDEKKRPDSFNYGEFAAVAHQYILRAQQRKIASLEERIAKLEAIINGLPKGIIR